MKRLRSETLIQVAKDLDLEPALLRAVLRVETGDRDGFLADNRPMILFEGHIMYKEVHKKFPKMDMNELLRKHPNVIYKQWDSKKYMGYAAEYDRLEEAKSIDEECAYKSASWGIGQIMGFNYKLCGCKDVFVFVNKNYESPEAQLRLWYYFMRNSKLIPLLKEHKWKEFSIKYNGSGEELHHYDQKLENAYNNFSKCPKYQV